MKFYRNTTERSIDPQFLRVKYRFTASIQSCDCFTLKLNSLIYRSQMAIPTLNTRNINFVTMDLHFESDILVRNTASRSDSAKGLLSGHSKALGLHPGRLTIPHTCN